MTDFNFPIVYTPGKENDAADALSRLYDPNNIADEAISSFDPEKLPDGLVVIMRVPGGGDSLLDSLHCVAGRMKLDGYVVSSAKRLREILVDELLNHSHLYHKHYSCEAKQKLRVSHCMGQLPSTDLMLSFSQLFHCLVLVHFGGDKSIIFGAHSMVGVGEGC